jgi:hypothetical protein
MKTMARFTPQPLYLRGKNPGAHFIEGWVGLETVWKLWNREEYFAFAGNRTPAVQPVVHRCTD